MPGMVPRTRCRSVPQMAEVVMRTIASVGSSIFGSVTSSRRISPTPCHTTAFTSLSSHRHDSLRGYPAPDDGNSRRAPLSEAGKRALRDEIAHLERIISPGQGQ
jgi:hypothetical protein